MKDPPLQANLRELIELPAGAGARCMLSPDTTINKQRCFAADNQKEEDLFASKLAEALFFPIGHLRDRCLFILCLARYHSYSTVAGGFGV